MKEIELEKSTQRQKEEQAPWLELRAASALCCGNTDLDVDITPMPSDCDQEWLCVDEANSFVYNRANGSNDTPLSSDCQWLDDSDQQWCWYEKNVVSRTQAEELEQETARPYQSDRWMEERKVWITASMAKTVAQ